MHRSEAEMDGAGRLPKSRWSSFVGDAGTDRPRVLHEQGRPEHRLRVEHDRETLLIHLSDEDGHGWTVFAVERRTRRWAAAQGPTQAQTAEQAYITLYEPT
jgi:hypothetical protein